MVEDLKDLEVLDRDMSRWSPEKQKKRQIKLATNIDASLQRRQEILKERATKKNIEYLLPPKYLKKLFDLQEGKCFYTKFPMTISRGEHSPFKLTVDRIDPKKGYVVENVVLCCSAINSLKGTMSVEEFKSFILKGFPLLQEWATQNG